MCYFSGKPKIIFSFALLSISIIGLFVVSTIMNEEQSSKPRIRSSSSPKAEIKTKAARQEYFHRLLRDPKTKQIPPRMRQSEHEYAQKLRASQILRKKTAVLLFIQILEPQ